MLKSRVHHLIKKDDNGKETFKTRLGIQGHKDPEKKSVVTEAPTVLRSSIRLILTLSAIYDFELWTRDVKQAFVQSAFPLDRMLFIKPPKNPDLMSMVDHLPDTYLHALKPIYGLTESPGFWWQTFKQYHIDDLGMKQTTLDPCLFYKKDNGIPTGIIGTLVDDTLGCGNTDFIDQEKIKSKKFDVKPKETEFPIRFGGLQIVKDDKGLSVNQFHYTDSLKLLDTKKFNSTDFAHLLGQLGYAASRTRPDVSFSFAHLSQVKNEERNTQHSRALNSAVQHLQKEKFSIYFPKLDLDSITIRGYSDAGFSNNSDLKSQLGILVLLKDKNDNACVIHYSSWKSRRVVRSVLAAELFAFVSSHDYCQIIAHDLHLITGKKFPVHLMTDSKSIFDTITKLSGVSEKRLMIDIAALRQSYSCGEITNIGHVLTRFNIADALTKKLKSSNLDELLKTGKIDHPVNLWIIHKDPTISQ